MEVITNPIGTVPMQQPQPPYYVYNYATNLESITEEKIYEMIEKVLIKFEKNKEEEKDVAKNDILKYSHFDISISEVKPLNPTLSMCKVSLYYEGFNRNSSFISHDVAQALNDTIGGVPIVGIFSNETEDFGDHGVRPKYNNEGKFIGTEIITKPYGFTPLDAPIFTEIRLDNDGVEREYYCTYGVIWTGKYPEASRILEGKNNHSMELDPTTFEGKMVTKNGKKCFEITTANFLALCILGENVEPCFEGGKFEGIETDFSLIKKELQDMMASLKDYQYGGDVMGQKGQKIRNFAVATDEVRTQIYKQLDEGFNYYCIVKINIGNNMNSVVVVSWDEDYNDKYYRFNFSVAQDIVVVDLESKVEVFILDVTEEEKATLSVTNMALGGNIVEEKTIETSAVTEQVTNVEFTKVIEEKDAAIAQKEIELAELREFKMQAERKEKQTLIDKYFMLTEADKKDCVDNIDKYSYTEIEAKLAIQLVNSKPDLFSVTAPAVREESTIATETNANNSQTAPNFALNDVAIGNNTPKATSWTEALAAREA